MHLRHLSYIVILSAPLLYAQDSTPPQADLTARTLYYNSGSDVEAKPVKQPRRPPVHTAPATTPTLPGTPAAQVTPPQQVNNLGLRYNLLLVKSGEPDQPVDSSTIFRGNDCLALSVQSNYEGFLYVLYHGSSGKWDVLLPSPDMAEESNHLPARTTVKVPAEYCFNIENPPGTEHLFVVLARSPQDVSELNSAIKASRGVTAAPANSGSDTELTNPPPIERQMARLEQVMRSRDLRITKVSRPASTDEPPNAVYVVDTTHSASDRIITEIDIKHN